MRKFRGPHIPARRTEEGPSPAKLVACTKEERQFGRAGSGLPNYPRVAADDSAFLGFAAFLICYRLKQSLRHRLISSSHMGLPMGANGGLGPNR